MKHVSRCDYNTVKANVIEILSAAVSPAMLCSFGSDSMLLLSIVREVRPTTVLYYFGDDLPEFAQQLVINDDLTVFSYAPADRYLVPRGEGLALIDEYDINGQRVPMVSKVKVSRGTCAVESDERNRQRTPSFYFPHDLVLWGYKLSDHVELIDTTFEREIQIGHTRFVTPLYDLTTDQVLNALDALGLDYVTNDDAEICDECLNAVVNSDWDRDAALAGFRGRFNYNH
jgi:hypothetical protein